jgi:hypothetical protein
MNRIGELVLTVLFQTILLFNAWGIFYLLFFAHFLQCFVQKSRYAMHEQMQNNYQYVWFDNSPTIWQYLPDSVVNQFQPPDKSTTQKNQNVKIVWGSLMAVSLLILIGAIVFAHMKLGLNTSEFILKNLSILAIIGALEGLFFFFVGWFDFPVSQAKGAADYLQEVLNNIQNKN